MTTARTYPALVKSGGLSSVVSFVVDPKDASLEEELVVAEVLSAQNELGLQVGDKVVIVLDLSDEVVDGNVCLPAFSVNCTAIVDA